MNSLKTYPTNPLHESGIQLTKDLDTPNTLDTIIMGNYMEALNQTYFILTGIMSCLSVCGCLVTILTYIAFKDLHSTGRQHLVCLSFADLLTACGNIMGIVWALEKDSLRYEFCKAHSALTAFSSISSYLWNVCIAVFLYMCLVKDKQTFTVKLTIPFHVICWCIPSKHRSTVERYKFPCNTTYSLSF